MTMTIVLEFLDRAFALKGAGWPLLLTMTGVTCFMIFSWIEHWPFRMIAAPSLFVGAAVTNALMAEHGLFVGSDATTNQAVGFGIGIVVVMVLVSSAAWVYYELKSG